MYGGAIWLLINNNLSKKREAAGPLAVAWPFLARCVCYLNHSMMKSSGYPGYRPWFPRHQMCNPIIIMMIASAGAKIWSHPGIQSVSSIPLDGALSSAYALSKRSVHPQNRIQNPVTSTIRFSQGRGVVKKQTKRSIVRILFQTIL